MDKQKYIGHFNEEMGWVEKIGTQNWLLLQL